MTNRGYKAFSERLKEHGYKYYPDHPWEGANSWIKWLVKDESTKVYVSVRVFHKEDYDTGEEVYAVSAEGHLEDKEKCPHLMTLCFGNHFDLTQIDEMMEEVKYMFLNW